MSTVNIIDSTQVSASLELAEKAPLSVAGLKNLLFSSPNIVSNFAKPIDQLEVSKASVGLTVAAPSMLIGTAPVAISAGTNAEFSLLLPKQKSLFGDDDFAPALKINPGECWAGLSVKATLKAGVSTPSGTALGLALKTATATTFTTFVHFPAPKGSLIPALQEGLKEVLENYSIPPDATALRAIPPNVAHTGEADGSVTLSASYSAPLSFNPLATAKLPFNLSLTVKPTATASVTGSFGLSGSFIVRTFKSSDTKLVIGLYKKHQTDLSVTFTASAGIAATVGSTDILAAVLKAIAPDVKFEDLKLDDSQKKDLADGLKECCDHSFAIAANACCSASDSDQAAVVYEIDLSKGIAATTDAALNNALKGDWSALDTLPSATRVHHILRDIEDRRHKITFNLLGFYNAGSISDYVKNTTVLHDEHGQATVVDKVSAESLSAQSTPYAADADKLRGALAEAFIATITYGACTSATSSPSAFTVRQSMLEYHPHAKHSDIARQLRASVLFKFFPNSDIAGIQNSKAALFHNAFYLDTKYDQTSVYHFFYQDVDKRTPRAAAELDRIGRDTRLALLDPTEGTFHARKLALNDDPTWDAMNQSGDPSNFRQIPSLQNLDPSVVLVISADWSDIRWWSDALQKVTPPLTEVLALLSKLTVTDLTTNPDFMAAREKLKDALAKLTSATHSKFADGWPVAVMNALCPANDVQVNLSVNGKSQSETLGAPIAKPAGA